MRLIRPIPEQRAVRHVCRPGAGVQLYSDGALYGIAREHISRKYTNQFLLSDPVAILWNIGLFERGMRHRQEF